MSTLIAVYRPGGRTQRCDARCYTAGVGTECDCICEGSNHSVGIERAVEQTRELMERWIAAARRNDPQILRVEIDLQANTVPLF